MLITENNSVLDFSGIHETVSPTVESAVWVDEAHHFHGPSFPSMKGPTSSSSLAKELNLLGGADQTALSPTKENDIKAQFGDKSTDVFSRNFSPDLYLLTNHMQCRYKAYRSFTFTLTATLSLLVISTIEYVLVL